jgi:hypothetical protein
MPTLLPTAATDCPRVWRTRPVCRSTQLHFPPINSPWPLPPTNAVSIPTTTSLTRKSSPVDSVFILLFRLIARVLPGSAGIVWVGWLALGWPWFPNPAGSIDGDAPVGIDGLSRFGQWLRLSDPIGTVPDAADSHISSPSLRAIISLELCTCSVSTSVLCHHTGRPDAVPPLFPLSSPSLSSSLPPDLCSQPATFGSLSVVSVSQTLGPHDPTASLTPFVCHLFGITVHSIYALRRGVYVGTFRA